MRNNLDLGRNHALISTTELIKEKLERGNFVAGIFIDLEKAFDTVNHVSK